MRRGWLRDGGSGAAPRPRGRRASLREPGLISDPKVNFSYFEIAMGRYGEVWARR
eukprot:COSAG05_NODE_1604_length_4427_cov_5.080869_1_plen_54_part_10